MYTLNRQLGKFEGNQSQLVARVAYETMPDDQLGAVDELGWYGLVKGRKYWYIVREDNDGFVGVTYERPAYIGAIWDSILKDYDEYYNEQEDGDGY